MRPQTTDAAAPETTAAAAPETTAAAAPAGDAVTVGINEGDKASKAYAAVTAALDATGVPV